MTVTAVDVKKTVTELNAGWYNYVCQQLRLSPETFLLAQGALGLQTADSSGLFLMSDVVPPSASVAFLDASGLSVRSSAYGLLLNALLPETGSDLRDALGDKYAPWIRYRNDYNSKSHEPPLKQEQLFEQWADAYLDPGERSRAINAYKKGAHCPLNQAMDALYAPDAKREFVDPSGQFYSVYPYTVTASAAQKALNTGGSANLSFDSSTMDTRLTHTTAQGSATGFYRMFSGGASVNFEQLDMKAASSKLSITGRIGQYATLTTGPLQWFTSAEFTRAYNAKNDNRIWDPQSTAGKWDSFFAQPNGSLARRISQLVLVSDYEITVRSHASYTQEEIRKIKAEAHFGFYPFFSAGGSGSQTTEYRHNDDATLSATFTLNPGLIQIWGANVQNAPN